MTTIMMMVLAAGLSGGFAQKSRTLEHLTKVTPSQQIELRGMRGVELTVQTWDRNEVSVKIVASIESSDKDVEEIYLRDLNLTEEATSSRLVITLREPSVDGSGGFSFKNLINLRFSSFIQKKGTAEVFVPKSNAFSTDLRYGSVSVENIEGPVELDGQSNTVTVRACPGVRSIRNDYGKTTIRSSGGSLRVVSKSGTVTVEDHRGSLDLEADYSKVTLTGVSGNVSLASKSGRHAITGIGGDLKVQSDYSTVAISDVQGFVTVNDKSGNVRVSNVEGVDINAPYSTVEITNVSGASGKAITIKGQSGSLDLTDGVGDVLIENPYSTVDLTNIRGNVDVSCQSGKVFADGVTGDWKSQSPYTSVSVRKLNARSVTATGQSGSIDIELVSRPASVEIRNAYGDIVLRIPGGFGGDVRLKAEYGKITSNFPLEVESLGSGAVSIGRVGTGTGSLRLETKSGNIRVNAR